MPKSRSIGSLYLYFIFHKVGEERSFEIISESIRKIISESKFIITQHVMGTIQDGPIQRMIRFHWQSDSSRS